MSPLFDILTIVIFPISCGLLFGLIIYDKRKTKIHYKIHGVFCHIRFILRIPKHLIFHDYELFTWNGAIICDCGYVEDLGYAQMDCRKCYDFEDERLKKIGVIKK